MKAGARALRAGARRLGTAGAAARRSAAARAATLAAPGQPSSTAGRAPARRAAAAAPLVASGAARPRICILGGGFGGLYAALKLEGLMWGRGGGATAAAGRPAITLVDQAPRFVFKPLLYELLSTDAGRDDVAPEYAALLAGTSVRASAARCMLDCGLAVVKTHTQIRFVQDSVAKVEPSGDGRGESQGRVTLGSGASLDYDWLIVALGAAPALGMAKGAKEHAIGFASLDDVRRVSAALAALRAAPMSSAGRAIVTIVGAGYAGAELAAMVADQLRGTGATVELLSPSGDLMKGQALGLVVAARRELERLGVSISQGKVSEVGVAGPPDPRGPDLGKVIKVEGPSGSVERRRADLVLWTAGQKPTSKLGGDGLLPFATSDSGMLATDATLRVLDQPRVFAIGDTASAETADANSFPSTAQVALQQADYVAWNLWASINRRPLLPFKYQHLGTMIALGSQSGAVSVNTPLPAGLLSRVGGSALGPLLAATGVRLGDSGSNVTLDGPLAAAVRRAAYVWRQPTSSQQLKVGASWVSKSLHQFQDMLAPSRK